MFCGATLAMSDCPTSRMCTPVTLPCASKPATSLHCVDGWNLSCWMSSSRDQMSFTGVPGSSFAIATAWRTQSWLAPRRPKPPPSSVL
jgi:hypothetical protein